MIPRLLLQDVFGVPPRSKDNSYVDRGNLDDRMAQALTMSRHVIIHGDSKQGKTWLRQKAISGDDSIVVQCQAGADPTMLLTEILSRVGIKAELKQKSRGELHGKLDVSASGELGIKLISKLKAGVKGSGEAINVTEKERLSRHRCGQCHGEPMA